VTHTFTYCVVVTTEFQIFIDYISGDTNAFFYKSGHKYVEMLCLNHVLFLTDKLLTEKEMKETHHYKRPTDWKLLQIATIILRHWGSHWKTIGLVQL